MIDIRNVFYSYENKFVALKSINLRINNGEAVALIGLNGSGKSTFMKIINGLIIANMRII